jgi:hypothetical protein
MRAAPKTRETRKLAVARGGVVRAHQLAFAEHEAKLAPVLRELTHLSSEMAARELELRGYGLMSGTTVRRARMRLGIPRTRRQQAEKKAQEEIVAG